MAQGAATTRGPFDSEPERDGVNKATSTQGSEGVLCHCSMVSSSSMLMIDVIHGSVGLRGMVTLTSHCSML
jgi:hypothetical protein